MKFCVVFGQQSKPTLPPTNEWPKSDIWSQKPPPPRIPDLPIFPKQPPGSPRPPPIPDRQPIFKSMNS